MRASDFEISNYSKLDKILSKLCEMVIAGQTSDQDYGMVGAAVLDPENNIVARLNYPGRDGKRVHAERAALEAYVKQYGDVPQGSIIVTTLSPCNEHMDERDGTSCTNIVNNSGVRKVYCGYMDPTQDNDTRQFSLMETGNRVLRSRCKQLADTFLDDVEEDYHPNDKPRGPETKPTMPAGTVRVDVSDVYDWYKLGQHVSNLKGLGKHDFGKGPPSTVMAFGSEPEEHKYIKALKKTGLNTTDIDPIDPKQPKGMRKQKTDPTYNVDEGKRKKRKPRKAAYGPGPYGGYGYSAGYSGDGGDGGGVEENFADGKNPQDKGDSKRHGINTKASVSSLRKTAKQGGRKGQLAHWLANMKSGRAKK